jgi:hypothetical protein
VSENSGDVRIKLTFNNEEVMVKMHDNLTSRDLLTLLPLTLNLEDFAGKEKISFLPKRLSTEDARSSKPNAGDFAYYSPWGNLALFYKGFGQSINGLFILGDIESGKEKLARINGDITVQIEKVNQ